jgi:hypothetical protein
VATEATRLFGLPTSELRFSSELTAPLYPLARVVSS